MLFSQHGMSVLEIEGIYMYLARVLMVTRRSYEVASVRQN